MAELQPAPVDSTGSEVFQYIPGQKASLAADDPSMKAFISTYPPLGQVTETHRGTTKFTALLEVDESRVTEDWQVVIWHSDGGEWEETPMKTLNVDTVPYALRKPNAKDLKRLYFTASLTVHHPTSFTVKFRSNSNQSWKWVKDHQGLQDGFITLISLTDQGAISTKLEDYVQGLNPVLASRNYRSQSPGTTLWVVNAPIEAANGDVSTIKNVKFGLPWGAGRFLRWFAVVRIWSPWLAPSQGKGHFHLNEEAILCSFLSNTGKHLVLLAISGIDDVMTSFTSNEDGNVVLRIRNDGTTDRSATILVGLGDNFESANAAVMYHARSLVAATQVASEEGKQELEALKDENSSTKLWAENWYDGLTYCTWNGLGQKLSEDKLVKAVEKLAQHNINITNFIIDDNWQSLDRRGNGQFQYGWVEFEADREAFPNGLKHTVNLIREKHPSIQHIAVWHALLGYWGGISPDGKIAKIYKTATAVRQEGLRRGLPLGGKMCVVAKEDVNKFYDDFYQFLSSCGVDGVKTDAQFVIDTFFGAKDRRELITSYQDAWSTAQLRHFSVKAISCMSQTPDILFHSQLPQNRPPILVRNSDDFFPEVPTSHTWHVFANAHNSLFTQHLNVVPDWDMFQTVHDYSGFHAAARCVSGGPIYITDVPGEHNMDLIKQMTGPTTRGKTVIFRPSVMGKSLNQYNGYHDDNLLLVGTYHGAAITGTGIIGIFNVSTRPLTELIPLSKFPGVVDAQYYIVRAHASGLISPPIQLEGGSPLLSVTLPVRGYDIFSSYPLRGFVDEAHDEITWIANLGLVEKMAAAAAVVRNKMEKLENGKIVVRTSLKALGVLGIYISILPKINWKDRMIVSILGKVVPVHTVKISKADKHVLEIDVEAAWKELDLESRWSNEVDVKIYINPAK